MLQAVLDVGGVGEVEMQTLNTLAPDASCTVPVIVTGCFVGAGVAVVTGGSVRMGVGVGVRTGVGVGTTVCAGVGDAVGDGVADGAGVGEAGGTGVGEADAVGAGGGTDVSIFGALSPSCTSAELAAARALAAASGWPAAC